MSLDTVLCTGCAACQEICPVQCITMEEDFLGVTRAKINDYSCIRCGLCSKVCPNNILLELNRTQKVYASWSLDPEVRTSSASGGIAFELYRYWIKSGGVATGVVMTSDYKCKFILVEDEDDIKSVQNSKYTFSETDGIYRLVAQKLEAGIKVLFIGMPCQVAGLYGFLGKDYNILTTVDIICHGMPPATYIKQHVEKIQESKKRVTKVISFRDPVYRTQSFTFTLRDLTGRIFYNKKVWEGDNFQLGYHKGLIYRDNCYNCPYACRKRIADITIGDFSGAGRFAPFQYQKENISCILQNTEKGNSLLKEVENHVFFDERPLAEAFEVEQQLRAPSKKHDKRTLFEEVYQKTQSFTSASNKALKKEKVKAKSMYLFHRLKVLIYSLVMKIMKCNDWAR